MSEIETVPPHTRYEVIAYANRQVPVYYEEFGSYQGEWVMLAKGVEGFYVYKGSYGSCSGCDSYEAQRDYSDEGWPMDVARKFAADYEPFIVIPLGTMETLCQERTLGEVLPRNFRDDAEDMWNEFPPRAAIASAFVVATKLDQGWPLVLADVVEAQNQELRQRALKAFGYERWITESGASVIDKDGDSELVKSGEMMFAHVKDSSTDRRYLLRVPPTMTRVREAIAWTFSMSEAEYRPATET